MIHMRVADKDIGNLVSETRRQSSSLTQIKQQTATFMPDTQV
jgi:hypothetical protein